MRLSKRSLFLLILGVWQIAQGVVLWEPARISQGRRASFSYLPFEPEHFSVLYLAVGVFCVLVAFFGARRSVQAAFSASFFTFCLQGLIFVGAFAVGVNPHALASAIPLLSAAGLTVVAASVVDVPPSTGKVDTCTRF